MLLTALYLAAFFGGVSGWTVFGILLSIDREVGRVWVYSVAQLGCLLIVLRSLEYFGG